MGELCFEDFDEENHGVEVEVECMSEYNEELIHSNGIKDRFMVCKIDQA